MRPVSAELRAEDWAGIKCAEWAWARHPAGRRLRGLGVVRALSFIQNALRPVSLATKAKGSHPVQLVILYVSTAAVFLILDAIMLTRVMKPLFETPLGDLLAEPIRIGPAAVLYLFYVRGLLYFVTLPA